MQRTNWDYEGMWVLKVKVISLPYNFQVLYVLCFSRPRYQVSVYRTIGPLVLLKIICFLAHLSQRLIGELIVYPWSDVCRSQCSNIFFSETAWPIKAKFYVEPPWVGGTKFCLRHVCHMTKMATTPIYGKNPSKIFSGTGGPISMKLGM